MVPSTCYQYSSLPSPHHIRLLSIVQSTTAEPEATLHVVNLNDKPAYDCLSYVWNGPHTQDVGDEWTTVCKTITLNGTPVLVRQNLYDAFISFRERGLSDPIWIDAVCINQDDIPERNAQVALMSRLYSDARDVIVWLGYEDAHAAVALQAMSRLSFSRDRLIVYTKKEDGTSEPDPDLAPITADFERCKFSDAEMCAILRFFVDNVWFSRVWTLQEMILARNMSFQCGGLTASLDVVWRGSAVARLFAGLCSAWNELKGLREFKRPYMFFHDMWGKYFQQMTGGGPSYIGIAADERRSREATDARDKVFGLLGISVTSTKSLAQPLVADYSKTAQEVFTRAALFGILAWQGWEALGFVGDRTMNKIPNLPSWVPDYTCELPWSPLQRSPCNFRTASSGLDAEFGLYDDHPSVIAPLYYHFDNVSSVCPALWTADPDDGQPGIVEVCNFLLDPCPILANGDDDVLFVLARTITADRTGVRWQDYDLKSDFERMAYCQLWRAIQSRDARVTEQLLRDPHASLLPALHFIGINNPETIHPQLEQGRRLVLELGQDVHLTAEGQEQSTGASEAYLDSTNSGLRVDWRTMATNRSLFRTQRGHLGLGPRTTQVGDRVGILQGAQVPYLFRHKPKDVDRILDLVGESYVHGIMYGELLEGTELSFTKITLY